MKPLLALAAIPCRWAGAIVLGAVLAMAGDARAETRTRSSAPPTPAELRVDLAAVPVVEVAPRPAFVRVATDSMGFSLPERERSSGRAVDHSSGPIARWAKPKDASALSVVRTNSLSYPDQHQAHNWLRFYHANPDVPAYTTSCGRGDPGPRSVESFTLARRADGSFHYVYHHVWFDFATCKGILLRHFDTPVTPIASGLAFAYRSKCAGCGEGSRERLHLVLPTSIRARVTSETGQFSYWTYMTEAVEASIEQGGSATFDFTFEGSGVRLWNALLPKPLPLVQTTQLRLEMVRGHRQTLPVMTGSVR